LTLAPVRANVNAVLRAFILVSLGVLLLAGLYLAWGQLGTVASVAQVADGLWASTEKNPPSPEIASVAPQPPPLAGFPLKFKDSLIIMSGGSPQDLDTNTLRGVRYWAFYYSASWCPPCRAFTPVLVNFYNSFKPSHPDFELIFVNEDRDESDMLDYMRADAMPWPAIRYADIDNPELEAKKYRGVGIPWLVLVDADGNVLSDTLFNGMQANQQHVIDDIRSMVP
jgi:nucleoredoxin